MRIWYDNEAYKCDITASSEETGYAATNLQNTQLKKTWRSTAIDDLIDRGNCESTTPPMIFDETVPHKSNTTFARDIAEAHTGTYSYKITKTIASGTLAYVSSVDNNTNTDMHGLVVGHTYTFSVWVYVPTASGIALNEVRLSLIDYQAAAWEYSHSSNPTAFDTWQKLSVTRTIRGSATGTVLRIFESTTADNNEYFYIDDIVLNQTQTIDFDAGYGVTIDADSTAILGHNLTSSVEHCQFIMSPNSDYTSATTNVAFLHATGLMSVYFAVDSQRYARLAISDGTNDDDYIEMGLVYIASHLQVVGGVGIDFPFQPLDSSTGDYSNSGQFFGDEGEILDLYDFHMPYINNALKANMLTVFDKVKTVKPIIMDFNESAHSSIAPLYCKFNDTIAFNHIAVAVGSDYDFHWNLSISLKECR